LRIDPAREPELWKQFETFIPTIEQPPVDAIAVTFGPGLEPALWVGINFAKALGAVWDIPVVPVNHMEGHIVSALLRSAETADQRGLNADGRGIKNENSKLEILNSKQYSNSKFKTQDKQTISYKLKAISYPALALLISGGHTELVLIKKLGQYEIIGETLDDAVGEAFDKVARILGLPYPGGPEISRLAERARSYKLEARSYKLPRPMLRSGDLNFSFSGLKTAVLYMVKKITGESGKLVRDIQRQVGMSKRLRSLIAREFEDAVTEVLISKTTKAIKEFEAKTLIIAGGVIANAHIRSAFEELRQTAFPHLDLLIPEIPYSTDNALMIAVTGFLNLASGRKPQMADQIKITAEGRARLS
jgi:N6-L-threonylcarbamoyladenine synthase